MWGLSNLWKEGKEGGYAVHHDPQPVSDFPPDRQESGDGAGLEHNFFEKAFPCLFPYGEGGIEVTRAVKRRQALGSARLQMRCNTFDADAQILSTKAQEEEEKNCPISDPAIRLLKRHIYATGGRVMGSDHKLWSTSIMLNPPSLWITINPCDLHDPIPQVFAATLNPPSKEKRAQNIALDPYAAAKFFHFMI
ncbi:hypothetical protein F4604DRAFT_1882876 [Suillus subluteus]|nr:hypothetical protein F4604DRAFT_1882876 [Suillus subluteus]